MTFDPRRSLRPALRELHGYVPIEPPEAVAARYGVAPGHIVKLDGNENPYGPAPRAVDALRRLGSDALAGAHRYPDPEQRRLREALGVRHGIDAACIVAGAGSDEVIDLLFRAYVEPGDRVLVSSPTFGMYAFGAELAGAALVDVPRLDPDWRLDEERLCAEAARAKITFIPSPNNPTGTVLPAQTAEHLLATGTLLVVDEAYIEFSHAGSLAERAAQGAPLVVLRTFSKWAGLAGLRVGYGVMPRDVAAVLMAIKQPYGVSVAAEAAAIASLDDAALLDERACTITGERDRVAALLRERGLAEPWPSESNFLLCRLAGPLAAAGGAATREALRRRGVFVRYFDSERLRDCLRISVGTPEENDRLLVALADAAAGAATGDEQAGSGPAEKGSAR